MRLLSDALNYSTYRFNIIKDDSRRSDAVMLVRKSALTDEFCYYVSNLTELTNPC